MANQVQTGSSAADRDGRDAWQDAQGRFGVGME